MHVDPAKAVKDALQARWRGVHPTWKPTLEVADDYQPVAGSPTLLVADDGGGMLNGGAWLVRRDLMRIDIRMTAFAKGRSEARQVLEEAIDAVIIIKPRGISRIENLPALTEGKDRATGAYLASITMPVLVRP